MKYINNKLSIEKINFQKIANKFETPFYSYSYSKLKENINNFKNSFKSFSPLICFAVKSNTNLNIIKEIKKLGLGADVVSQGELMMALKAGINPNKIVFSGVGKTSNEISFAIEKKILLINAESLSEVKEINRIAKFKNRKVNIGVRLNPDTDAKTLIQISTGKKENKFGVNKSILYEIINYCNNSNNINLKCLSVHIGSQILDYKPYEKMLKTVSQILSKTDHSFEYIDLGGGMGITYSNKNKKLNYKKYNTAILRFLKIHKVKIIFEPGRSIIGNTGTLVTKIIYIKESGKKDFIILDAAMNDLMRPALYGAFHKTLPVIKSYKISKKIYEFVGPICESTDKFITLKRFQKLKEKDLIAICDVGAYGMSLSSNYNLRPKLLELLIKGSKIIVIRKRQNYKELI
ncbi:MAG: diaminopimelate decarboxylase [Pelagibacterales bacterium MED-G42]|nr:MAG: diaminopimelate decarboxylase [Pelagibacterales bacterium MED-G42]